MGKDSSGKSLLMYLATSWNISCCCLVASHVQLFATPWTAACQASLSFTISQSLIKLMSIRLVIPSNYLILCHPILLLPSIFPSIRVFSNESALHIRWPNYWSFSFSISPSYEYSGLIFFRIDWFDLIALIITIRCVLTVWFVKFPLEITFSDGIFTQVIGQAECLLAGHKSHIIVQRVLSVSFSFVSPRKLGLEKAMATHSSALAWKIPWMEEPGGLQSMGLLRVGHDWATSLSLFTFMHWRRKWQPTPVFLPGES